MSQIANRYHFTESDYFDVRGDDSLRLVWDHPSHPWRWSASIAGLGGSFGELTALEPDTPEVDWPYHALLRQFDLPEAGKPYPLDLLFRLSPERLRLAAAGRSRLETVTHVVSSCPATRMKPREFFVSWCGVPTLAFTGFSQYLLGLKSALETDVVGLGKENPGAKWPKITLGALRDGRVLSLEEATTLRNICDELQQAVEAEPFTDISELSFVLFASRSLERRLLTYPVRLHGGASELPDNSDALSEHLRFVDATMAQFARANLPQYLKELRLAGNREPHYRDPHAEATLVFDFAGRHPECVHNFRLTVEKALPSAYRWFDDDSLHLTIRGLA